MQGTAAAGPARKGWESRTAVLAETLSMVALSAALSTVILFTFPQGGSITLASMVPIFVLSLRRGAKVGIFAGACLGIIVLVITPFYYNPIEFLLDYPLAFGALGLCGLFKKRPVVGVGVGIFARFLCHFTAGVLFFCGYNTTSMICPVYSVVYNASYLIPEFFISAAVILVLERRNILTVPRG
ncbi:MAG TPA: energy-coupled thiamine transporter ThiT [Conexivisphaerales archaeon]|nr:energy-coupled thiamine transporter ThiT [Conexivisphaerales archaeon]